MKALSDFFSTDYGLLSAGVILFMLGMVAFFVRYFVGHMKADEERMRAAGKG